MLLRALEKIGWKLDPSHKSKGSHRRLVHPQFAHKLTFAFHDSEEVGPKMLARIAKDSGLKPEDL